MASGSVASGSVGSQQLGEVMAYHADSSEARELRASGLGLILYSVVFVALLAYGWNFIIGGFLHPAISWLGALVMALLTWVLAKIIGGSERGIRGNKALFTALLILSAVGVFNTLMIRLEGKAIFGETIEPDHQCCGRIQHADDQARR